MSSPSIDTLTSVKVHQCRKEPHFDAICVYVYIACLVRHRRFSLSYVSRVLFSLEFFRGLSSAVSGPVEVGEEHEEDRRVK